MYLGWYDSSKLSIEQKIRNGLAAYQERYGVPATAVLVHAAVVVEVPGVVVLAKPFIRPDHFWIGQRESVE